MEDQRLHSCDLVPVATHLVIQNPISAQSLEREVQQCETRSSFERTVRRPLESRSRQNRVVVSTCVLFGQIIIDPSGGDRDGGHDDFVGVVLMHRVLLDRHRDRVAIVRDQMALDMLRIATSVPFRGKGLVSRTRLSVVDPSLTKHPPEELRCQCMRPRVQFPAVLVS